MDQKVACSHVWAENISELPASDSTLSALGMVKSVKISNFRGFKQFEVDDLALINIIVGDNAIGKTALLEAIYLVVSGNAQQPFNLRQWRGQDIKFQTGSADSVVEGIYADLFHDAASEEPIVINLTGSGFENRQLTISRSRGDVILPTEAGISPGNRHDRRAGKRKTASTSKSITIQQNSQFYTVPIVLAWTDEHGGRHDTRVLLSAAGLQFEGTNETIPNCFFYASQVAVPSAESATHFASLKKRRDAERFRKIFMSIFEDIRDIDLGSVANSSVLIADVPWSKELLPLQIVSGGTNRAAAFLLAITHRENGLVLVDEVESGIFYRRQKALSTALVELSRAYNTQLLMTTHSEEWIENFLDSVDENAKDIAFWRMERIGGLPTIRRFGPSEYKMGLAIGEMR